MTQLSYRLEIYTAKAQRGPQAGKPRKDNAVRAAVVDCDSAPGEPIPVMFCGTLAECEAWVAEREKIEPENVHRGRYGIDAEEGQTTDTMHLQFTPEDCLNLADVLEGLNRPNNPDPALRRLTDALWALGNDTDQVVITAPGEER